MANNGDKIIFNVKFNVSSSPTGSVIKFYFAGSPVTLLTGAVLANYCNGTLTIIRVSSSVARIYLEGVTAAGSTLPVYSELTSKDWTVTNILKCTGQCATNTITAAFGFIEFKPAAE